MGHGATCPQFTQQKNNLKNYVHGKHERHKIKPPNFFVPFVFFVDNLSFLGFQLME